MPRSAYDSEAARRVTAWALIHECEHAGNVVVAFSREGNATATVSVWRGPLAMDDRGHGGAGGGGYNKASAAVADALMSAEYQDGAERLPWDLHGAGMGTVRKFFEGQGYTVAQVLS